MDHLLLAAKALKKTFFHKPEPDEAICHYQDAAQAFRTAKDFKKAAETFEICGDLASNNGDHLTAAVNFKAAAQNFTIENEQARSKKCLEKSIFEWKISGKFTEAARCLVEVGEVDEGVAILLEENKPAQAMTALQEFAELAVENKEYRKAVIIYKQVYKIIEKMGKLLHKLDQVCLCNVILCLKMGDIVSAEQESEYFNDFNSDDCQMAEKLISGVKNKNKEEFDEGKMNTGGRLSVGNVILAVLNDLAKEQEEVECGDVEL
ncbi:Alpha-SNAP [Spironucleus salmonicida]|uniref:Gamma-soluble NSF attachment protein n=1 Tax=Spironucleus salmonicida TaxID=348837 RepID=V6LUN3_9EUKA|nr:Alpha-SNAP [Spironucleus salmonicida]|eukprot:EST48337.1 Alpha-SNAP [Spironucleus salmonicida]